MTDHEHELERLARTLGADRAERVDPDAVAQAVLQRLRATGRERPWWRRADLLAAALVILLGGALIVWRGSGGAGPVGDAAPAILAELPANGLAEVWDSLAAEQPVSELVAPWLGGLTEEDLEHLLENLNGS